MSRPVQTSRTHTRRAKSLLRNPLSPSPFRPKFDPPSLPQSTSRKRTFSLISGQTVVETDDSKVANDLMAARDAHIYKLNEEIVDLRAGERRRDGINVVTLERKLRSLEEENERLVRENGRLERGMVEMQGKVDQFADSLETQRSDFDREISVLTQEIAALKVENSDLTAKDRSSKEDLSKISGIVKDMKVMNLALEDKIAALSIDMEQANKEKYELLLRLQSLTSTEETENTAKMTENSDARKLVQLSEIQKSRIAFLEKHREAMKSEMNEQKRRFSEKIKELDTIFASFNKQITDLSAEKTHLEAVLQITKSDLETEKSKTAKAKTRIIDLKKSSESHRAQIRSLQTEILQVKSDLSAHKSNQKEKTREFESLRIKVATAMEALWLKETEILRKESIKLRLEDELRTLKSQPVILSKSKS